MDKGSVNIGTWIYCDSKEQESKYPQVRRSSSSASFQEIYWRCVVVYFATSFRNNPTAHHVLFSNVNQVPNLGKFPTGDFLDQLGVQVITLPLTYQTPPNYWGSWRNQFYIFDILNYLSKNSNGSDFYTILDSDCVWINSASRIVNELKKYELLTYEIPYDVEHIINGLSRIDMKKIYEKLDGKVQKEVPKYFGGEWFAATGEQTRRVAAEVDQIWEFSLESFATHQLKFNEEAHVLSYIYHKLEYLSGTANPLIRRIWTSKYFNNVRPEDINLDIWHLPAEKIHGIKRLFRKITNPKSSFWNVPLGKPFVQYMGRYLGIPKTNALKYINDRIDNKISGIKNTISLATKYFN